MGFQTRFLLLASTLILTLQVLSAFQNPSFHFRSQQQVASFSPSQRPSSNRAGSVTVQSQRSGDGGSRTSGLGTSRQHSTTPRKAQSVTSSTDASSTQQSQRNSSANANRDDTPKNNSDTELDDMIRKMEAESPNRAGKARSGNGRLPTFLTVDDLEALLEAGLPLIAPILAFYTYPLLAQGFSSFLDTFSSRDWIAVDGGALQAKVIAPAINGLVVPATSLLYATLTSTTITTLRQRQVDIRNAISQEAGELRYLCQLVKDYPTNSNCSIRNRCRGYLLKYTKRLVDECQPNSGNSRINVSDDMDTELNDFVRQINQGYGDPIPVHLCDQSISAITKLRQERFARITALQSTYPALHYATLALLALADCIAFLIETNQDLLFFLNDFELKILWSMIVGTFVACFTLFYDLLSPFAGSYQILPTVDQLYRIRRTLVVDVFDDNQMVENSKNNKKESSKGQPDAEDRSNQWW